MKNTFRKGRVAAACLTLLSVSVLSACGSGDDDKKTEAVEKLGKTEGKVSILAWPGYVEDGSNDPEVDWVSAFEKETWLLRRATPSPGAVCPAMVMLPATLTGDFRSM